MNGDPLGALLEIGLSAAAKYMFSAAVTIAGLALVVGVAIGWLIWG